MVKGSCQFCNDPARLSLCARYVVYEMDAASIARRFTSLVALRASSRCRSRVGHLLLLRLRGEEDGAEILQEDLATAILVAEIDDLLQLVVRHILTQLLGDASQILETDRACEGGGGHGADGVRRGVRRGCTRVPANQSHRRQKAGRP